jgi:site-specific recombinase XerD
LNATAQRALVDLARQRLRPNNPTERLFPLSYRQTANLFARAVDRAKETLRDAGVSAAGLEGVTWHSARHTLASRLVLSGADLRPVQELGGWRTLALVARYSQHLRAAVGRIGGLVGRSRSWTEAGLWVEVGGGGSAVS